MVDHGVGLNLRRFLLKITTAVIAGMMMLSLSVKADEMSEAYYAAEKINRIDNYQQFMSTYPGSVFEGIIKIRIEELEFKNAVSQHTVAALDLFIWMYPEGVNLQSAKYKRVRLLDTVEEYNAYFTVFFI